MRLILLDQAKQDLADIARYITKESGDRHIGYDFAKRLLSKCRDLVSYPYQMGSPRDELRKNLRSFPFGSYVIFFQYEADTLNIITIIHGSRDIIAMF